MGVLFLVLYLPVSILDMAKCQAKVECQAGGRTHWRLSAKRRWEGHDYVTVNSIMSSNSGTATENKISWKYKMYDHEQCEHCAVCMLTMYKPRFNHTVQGDETRE